MIEAVAFAEFGLLVFVSGLWWEERKNRIKADKRNMDDTKFILATAAKIRELTARASTKDEHENSSEWSKQ